MTLPSRSLTLVQPRLLQTGEIVILVCRLTSTGAQFIFTFMDEYKSSQLDGVFGAMADPTRRAILARLALADARVTELAGDFPISLNSTSKHIKMLERAGLVVRSVQGRDHVLSLNAAPLLEAAKCIEQYRRFWEDSLTALDAFITARRHAADVGKVGKLATKNRKRRQS